MERTQSVELRGIPRMRARTGMMCCATCAALIGLAVAAAAQSPSLPDGGWGETERPNCMTPEDWASIAQSIAEYEREYGGFALRDGLMPVDPEKFTFFPMAGNLYGDLFTNNFVDLDPSAAVLDWDCTDYSYDGHDAADVDIRGFSEQSIGVPIFAAQDGVVVGRRDGEDDMHTSCTGLANYVALDHVGGRRTYYLHMKKNSVQVTMGQQVVAGQQLGLTGSSGCSTFPHLHFSVYDNGNLVEPYAGACRPGASEWVNQTPINRTLYLRDFNITDANLNSFQGPPFDMPRTGTFVSGTRTIYFWMMVANHTASSTWRFRFRRPDGTIALDNSGNFDNPFYRWSWWWWNRNINLNQTGTWHILMDINGTQVAEAPFDVVSSAGQIVNRAPNAVSALIEPPSPTPDDVLICRVNTDLILDDRDYDVVAYRYIWNVAGQNVRDVTTAAHSDVLPRLTAPAGALVQCTVIPSDGTDNGPTTSDAVAVRPTNDDCADAIPLFGDGTWSFEDNTYATTDGLSDGLCLNAGQNDVARDAWFLWTSEVSGDVTVSTCGLTSVDTRIAVYYGAPCPDGYSIEACNDDACSSLQSSAEFFAYRDFTYLIRLGTFPLATGGSGSFTISTVSAEPANDNCAAAQTVTDGQTAGTNYLATIDGASSCGFGSDQNDVWYRYVATCDGTLNVGAQGVNSKILSVHSACPGSAANDLACSYGTNPSIAVSVTSGQTVYIRVARLGDASTGPFTLNIECNSLYSIGDLNCDGVVDLFDIDPFVIALTDPAGYAAMYPGCDRDLADANQDGVVDLFDIDPFVMLLAGP